eukprot:CAMPEP_0184332634 /NCGR_PEP_ID=MMETSP1089-20130417/1793_1 /TAXON_ID=38269 ORGANISM="Gloeochaete wittrockiana, Strain SAG46.84" /NCGR_SAMPLE_ID=MMETSP1089 /ASSEMBLY_ACC=CAM_ASM_000445 /LENGTH=632 /DNA_ID=CAMNT_0026656105 /DNA_START=19 /DNA_END=1917 /DNA_ORIENTATION=+
MADQAAFCMSLCGSRASISRGFSLCHARFSNQARSTLAHSSTKLSIRKCAESSLLPLYEQRRTFFGVVVSSPSNVSRFSSTSHNFSRIVTAHATPSQAASTSGVRVRFAPSPTGHLHVGGARTALFNWLFAKHKKGKFIVRVEDTDVARSTRESEEAVLRDLRWLGVHWDEGPDVGGPFGPYRQSERFDIYKEYGDKLVGEGHAYPCFCTEETLEEKRKQAEAEKRPPHYDGTCRHLSAEEVKNRIAAGESHTYRFKVPSDIDRVVIDDLIRGEVSWGTDTVGDFILLRSSGMPVYNFCVAVDDALMQITHVIRAEEHLSNTLRQILIYQALGFPIPMFAHVSLILGEDRSKLSKRHGATSVDQFGQMGFLAPAMINYLSLLGWNDGTEQEFYSVSELIEKFSLDRITKSAAVFDQTKLTWINAQHLKGMPKETIAEQLAERWEASGAVVHSGTGDIKLIGTKFMTLATDLFASALNTFADGEVALISAVSYPLLETFGGKNASSTDADALLKDGFTEFAARVVQSYDDGELNADVQSDTKQWKDWVKAFGAKVERKGKKLFMPLRLALTGQVQGPDVGESLRLVMIAEEEGVQVKGLVRLPERIEILRQWLASASDVTTATAAEAATAGAH